MIAEFLTKMADFTSRHPKLKLTILKLLPSSLIEELKLYILSHRGENSRFHSFFIKDLKLNFSLGPLEDRRGIGRVAREQFNFLKERYSSPKTRIKGELNYYTSIHWVGEDEDLSNTIVMVHDVIPLIFPELFPEASKIWKERYKKIAQRAKHIITISNSSKRDIVKHLELNEKDVSVVYNGVTELKVKESDKLKELVKERYFVYIGSYDHHKNLSIILKALEHLKSSGELDKNLYIYMVGDNIEALKEAKELGVEDRVKFLGKLKDEEMGYIVKNSIALLFPSLYEGFGLPPLEAGLLKVPSICSNNSAMLELLDGVTLFADAYKKEEWAKNMLKFYRDRELRDKYGELAYKRCSQYSWENSCSNLIQKILEHR
jgi:glycosyltransferase involved in cell wall biosynthesis